jgi:peptide chain release factor 2
MNEKAVGNFDNRDAILSVYAGAGGKDAQDWAMMLFKMYAGFCKRRGFQFLPLILKRNEYGGLSEAVALIKGPGAYGLLKNENGVHRLVRLSPFSSAHLRHTSFALVEILPEIEAQEMPLKENDLKIETYRASGPGGQNVQKVETAVRIRHLPTGLVVTCEEERSQYQNKEKAMAILRAKLKHLADEQKVKTINELKGEKIKIEWSNQIRSYILHPYHLVKDHRSKKETREVEEVLEGNLDKLIN